MLFKRVALIVVLALAMVPSSALADSLLFSFGNGVLDSGPLDSFGDLTTTAGVGAYSNLGSVTWVSSSYGTAVFTPSSGPTFGSVDITTGTITSGTTDAGATFAPGGQINITSNNDATWGPSGIGIPNTLIFSGSFSGPASWVYDPVTKDYTLTGDISVTPGYPTGNAAWPTFESMWPSLSPTGYINLTGTYAAGNSSFDIQSGSVFLPEPGTLSMLGFGLIGLAGLGRKRYWADR